MSSENHTAQRVGIAVIGAGRIGLVHCEALNRVPDVHLVAVADFVYQAATTAAKKFHIPLAFQDWKEVLKLPQVRGIVVCSPSDTHADIIVAAAHAGKHIFCEKPIDYDLKRIDQALSAVERAGVLFQLGFQRRFDANFRRVRQAVKSGEIGSPYMLHIVSRDPAPPPISYIKQSGGLFFDMMTHDFDMARFCMGSEIIEVTSLGANLVDPAIGEAGDIDSAIVSIKFANGCIGTIECCRKAAYGYDQRIEVLGSNGSVNIGNNYPNTAIISDSQTIHRDLPLNFFMDRYKDAYAREMETFVDVIQNHKTPPVGGIDGRIPVVLAYAALKSMKEKRTVRVDEIDAQYCVRSKF
ncbi:hypothetical protein GpartN1_g2392.t1 [Galdieria partita]|uniref:Inositol 2-dehydrogenase n=1 Tax=Galdieria partita TaxID=83374 RepID=A0A9C7UPH6_9RHOD|nr:hypothetical protein GpartN1_g2392.t1 [Galdieria partita]